jgi:hypothetical protein
MNFIFRSFLLLVCGTTTMANAQQFYFKQVQDTHSPCPAKNLTSTAIY